MAAANSTNKSPILHLLFGNELIEQTWKKDSYLNDIKKKTTGLGKGREIVVRVQQLSGTSPSFSRAVANQNPASEQTFTVTAKTLYTVFSLTGLFLRQAKGKPNSLVKGYAKEAASGMRDITDMWARAAWNHEGGAIDQIATTTNTATTTLTFRNAGSLFGINPVGKQIAFSSDNGSGSSPAGLRSSGGAAVLLGITAVDFKANQVTVDAALSTVPSITTNDYVFFDGFYAAAMSGKRAWNPPTAPSSGDSFFGVDRSTSVEYLSGWRQTTAGLKEMTLIEALTLSDQGNTDGMVCYTNRKNWGEIVKEVGAKYVRDTGDGKQGMGAKGLVVYGPDGEAVVKASNHVPYGNAWLGNPDQDMFVSEGPAPDILNEDNVGPLLRSQGGDSYESRLGMYGNFMPDDSNGNKLGPGAWVIITW